MNAERLHAIATALRNEARETAYPEALDNLAAGLQAMAESPGQAGPQEQVSNARESLSVALRDAPSNEFSPGWEESLREMGVYDLRGEPLLEDVEAILGVNQMTPTTAAAEVGKIRQRVAEFIGALEQTLAAFDFLKIGTENLSIGEFEIGFMIPRGQVNDEFEKLGKEFVKLKRLILPFSEIAGDSRPQIRVRSISSSEFQVFLESTQGTALVFFAGLQSILAAYDKVLDIRMKHRELAENPDVPKEVTDSLAQVGTDLMDKKTREIADELIERFSKEAEDRNNELRTELRLQLNALAQRVDRGYNIEVRTGELPESVDGDEEGTTLDADTQKAAETILEGQASIQYMNVSGTPVLHLEQPDDDEDEGDDGQAPPATAA
jgi:hypothetical protein